MAEELAPRWFRHDPGAALALGRRKGKHNGEKTWEHDKKHMHDCRPLLSWRYARIVIWFAAD